jgi:hypothetical protein
MFEFEKNYFVWASCLKSIPNNMNCYAKVAFSKSYVDSLNNLVETINNLKNTYPPSYLIDCEDIKIDNNGDFFQHPIVLNKTALKSYDANNIWQVVPAELSVLEPSNFSITPTKSKKIILDYLDAGKQKNIEFNSNGSLAIMFKIVANNAAKRTMSLKTGVGKFVTITGNLSSNQAIFKTKITVKNQFSGNVQTFLADIKWNLAANKSIIGCQIQLHTEQVIYEIKFSRKTIKQSVKTKRFFLTIDDESKKYGLVVDSFSKRLLQEQHELENLYFESQSNCVIRSKTPVPPSNLLEEIIRAMTLQKNR